MKMCLTVNLEMQASWEFPILVGEGGGGVIWGWRLNQIKYSIHSLTDVIVSAQAFISSRPVVTM